MGRPSIRRATARAGRTVCALKIAVVIAVAGLVHIATAVGQFGGFERPIVIRNARIVTMTGPVIENGSIRIKGGMIEAIGPEVTAPFLSKTIDVGGKTITPGFIDTWSSLGHLGSSSTADPTASAFSAFDRYAREDFREALRHGVTTVYVGPYGGPGVCGLAAVVRLMPDKGNAAGKLLSDEAALCVNLGSDRKPIARLKTLSSVRKQFRAALEYRRSLEDYEEDLKEYLEKLEERAAKNKKDDKGEDEKEGKDHAEPSPDDDTDEPEEKDESPEDEGGERARAAGPSLLTAFSPQNVAKFGSNGEPAPDEKKPAADGEETDDEDEDLKKPARPKPDRKSDVLLRAIDHELVVRITAHRSEDILNALEFAAEFYLDIIIEGATDAHLVAESLAKADVTVVLGPVNRTGLYEANEFRRHSARCAALLDEAGVPWSIGSGATTPSAARFVALNAQLAVSHGATHTDWLRKVTVDAARAIGAGERIGRLARGMLADLVVWNGDPADPSATVDRVFVGGRLVFEASGKAGR